jgi:hypothetical protein
MRILAVLACALVGLLAAASTSSASHPLRTAIEEPPTDDIDLVNARIAGTETPSSKQLATFVRIILYWNDVAPASEPSSWDPTDPNDPAYDWSTRADSQIHSAVNHGLKPIVVVWRAPTWAENRAAGDARPTGTVNPDPVAFGQFARAVAQKYLDVHHWEAWNEPNGPHFLNPQLKSGKPYSPTLYRQLLNKFALGIHAIRSGDTVSAAGLAPAYKIPPLTFLRKLFCLSSTNKPLSCPSKTLLDATSHHPYTNGGPFTKSKTPGGVALGNLPSMRKVLVAAKKAGRIDSTEFWVTEFSWDTKGPDPLAVPLSLHARWISEALYQAYRSGVSLFTWHQLRDRPFPAFTYQSGLYFCGLASTADDPPASASHTQCDDNGIQPDDAAKAASIRSFRFPFVVHAKNGRVSVWGRIPSGESDHSVDLERQVNGHWRLVKRVSADGNGIFSAGWRSSDTTHLYRASLTGGSSNAFSLRRPKPFSFKKTMWGCGGGIAC